MTTYQTFAGNPQKRLRHQAERTVLLKPESNQKATGCSPDIDTGGTSNIVHERADHQNRRREPTRKKLGANVTQNEKPNKTHLEIIGRNSTSFQAGEDAKLFRVEHPLPLGVFTPHCGHGCSKTRLVYIAACPATSRAGIPLQGIRRASFATAPPNRQT